MLKPKRVGHLVLNVRDQGTSAKFYTEVLGFEIAFERSGFGVFLTCGRVHHDLALFQAAEDAAPATPGGLGLNHMALQVEDFDALTQYYHRLADYGVEIDRATDHGMTKSIYFRDPDGNGIELFCDTKATDEEGLAEMRRPDRRDTELVFS